MNEDDMIIRMDMKRIAREKKTEAAAEIERLRTLKTPASRELLDITKGCLDDAEAEVERLRALVREAADEIGRLRAENNRLRSMLWPKRTR